MEQESAILEIYKSIQRDKETSPEYNRLRRKAIEFRDEFENDLDPEQRKALNELIEQRTVMEEVECREYFIEGFVVATKIMTEVFYKDEINKQ